MKIGIQTWGTEGDVRPFLALAHGLSNAGHDVTLVAAEITNRKFTAIAERLGFSLRHVHYTYHDKEQVIKIIREMFLTWDAVKQIKLLMTHLFHPVLKELLSAAKMLCADNDLVIGSPLVYPLKIAALQEQRPFVMVFLQPMMPSRFVPPVNIPYMGARLNALWWKFADMVVNLAVKADIDRIYQRERLQPERSLLYDIWNSPLLTLVASSPALFPPPPDWNDRYHFCGFFNLPDSRESYQMPDDLAQFLSAGEPPVFMTFGSMLAFEESPCERIELLLEATRIAGCRAIIQANWNDWPHLPESPDIYRMIRAPHHHIFPHCKAVVHHGGAGTTQTATLAGCPSIVVEHFTDQPLWGSVVHRNGMAPKMLHRHSLTAKKLARAIQTVLKTPSMKKKAEQIGAAMKQEDGVARAVNLIERINV